jgi:bifunctional oligoribonuclease and PAP phosphatase NrnA
MTSSATMSPAPSGEAEWSRAVKILDAAQSVWLACHVRPDADALGSMLAFASALTSKRHAGGRPATAVAASFGDDPFEVPAILHFLPGQSLLRPPAQVPDRPEVMVSFDAGSIDRLGLLAGRAAAAGELIVLDHHASNTGFGTVSLVDPSAAATAVLAAELIRRLGIPLSQDIALGLYAGLVTDTGSFKYAATTPQVHELAARLLATGIDPGTVARELYDRAPFGYLGMLSAALGRATLDRSALGGLGVVWTTVTRADRDGLLLDAAESVIDLVRKTDEAEVAAVLKEDDKGTWQVSVRSKSLIDVSSACTALGGGGHARAAGFSYSGGAGAAVAVLVGLLEEQAPASRQ